MRKEFYKVGEKEIMLLLPEGEFDTLLYVNDGRFESMEEIYGRFEDPDFAVCVIKITEWFKDLTPWYAPTTYESGPDFDGNAPQHLRYMVDTLIPFVEEKTGVPQYRGIAGYSLGGLFSLYAFYETDSFFLCGCVAGSLWFDGFMDWLKERKPKAPSGSIFFSVGERERYTKYTRMAITDECMKEACKILQDMDYDAFFKYTKGDHMDYVDAKMEEALRWLLGK